jgi:hypothetical protein
MRLNNLRGLLILDSLENKGLVLVWTGWHVKMFHLGLIRIFMFQGMGFTRDFETQQINNCEEESKSPLLHEKILNSYYTNLLYILFSCMYAMCIWYAWQKWYSVIMCTKFFYIYTFSIIPTNVVFILYILDILCRHLSLYVYIYIYIHIYINTCTIYMYMYIYT